MRHGAGAEGETVRPVELHLLGCFTLRVDGAQLGLPRTGQRLLVRLALSDGVESRSVLAGTLWPEHTESRAQANLRGTVWRLPAPVHEHLVVGTGTVAFDAGWDVDLHAAGRPGPSSAADGHALLPDAGLLRHDLLPDWDEHWLLVERERHRQLRLHTLEDLARHHLQTGRPLEATDCALVAVAADPLRESAQALLLRSHLAAGNRAMALIVYEQFRALLAAELGVEPSAELTAVIRDVASRPGRMAR